MLTAKDRVVLFLRLKTMGLSLGHQALLHGKLKLLNDKTVQIDIDTLWDIAEYLDRVGLISDRDKQELYVRLRRVDLKVV
jgi:hypothetical protein